MMEPSGEIFLVFNPKAGKEGSGDELRATLGRLFPSAEPRLVFHETAAGEDIAAACRAARDRGASLVIAAGGDGTLVGVANGLAGGDVPLGIIPLGTGNILARALGIPLVLQEAAELLAGDHDIAAIDALEVAGRFYFTNVSVGISAGIIDGASTANKKLFGRLAYVMAIVQRSAIFQSHHYRLSLDGKAMPVRATEILVSSGILMETADFLVGPAGSLSDGKLEVYVLRAHSLSHFMRLAWDLLIRLGKPARMIMHHSAERSVRIDHPRRPLMVQADGEVIGRTPVDIRLMPKALLVIAPKPQEA